MVLYSVYSFVLLLHNVALGGALIRMLFHKAIVMYS